MKGKAFIKRLTIYSSLITILFMVRASNVSKKSKEYFKLYYKVTKNKIEYNDKTIYIGDENYLKTINSSDDDILVLDKRNAKDPDLKIYDSYKIIDPISREDIIDGLLYYEELYPTNWNRTRNSLIREWRAHNIMHMFGYETDRTTDVDLNNADEEKYRIKRLIIEE